MTAAGLAPTPRLVRRNYGRGHGYKIDGHKVPGVTTALGILSKDALVGWAARQSATYAVDHWDELAGMGPAQRLDKIEKARWETNHAATARGTEIHALGEKLVHGVEVDVPDEHRGPVEAYARFLDRWGIDPIAAETPLGHSKHYYGGTADLWANVGARDNAPALIDLKTGKGVYDETALQLAAYRFADLCVIDGVEQSTPEVEHVYVAHILPDAVRLVPVVADLETFKAFLYALTLYRVREGWKDWPLIGSAVDPDGDDS